MTMTSFHYRLSESSEAKTLPLDSGLQAVLCADAATARNLSRLMHRHAHADKVGAACALDAERLSPLTATAQEALTPSPVDGSDWPPPWSLIAVEDAPHLDDGGDALARELFALLDTGRRDCCFERAIEQLDAYAAALGREGAAETPIVQARARIEVVKEEAQAAAAAQDAAAALGQTLRQCRESLTPLQERIAVVEEQRRRSTAHRALKLRERLREVRGTMRRIDGCVNLSSDEAAAIKRAQTAAETARLQLEQDENELEGIEAALREIEHAAPRTPASDAQAAMPEQLLRDMRASLSRIAELNARLDEVSAQLGAIAQQMQSAQEQLSTLPDFSQIAYNPVDWLNQLARSFKTALISRDEEIELRDALRAQTAELRADIAGDAEVFKNSAVFAQQMLEHESKKKRWDEQRSRINEGLRHYCGTRDQLQERVPGFFFLALGCTLFLCLLLGAYVGLRKTPILYPAAWLLAASLVFSVQLLLTRRRATHLSQRIAEAHAELDLLDSEDARDVSEVERLMARAGCATPRELEARYDRYRELSAKLQESERRLRQQIENARESEERIPLLFARVRCALEQLDEKPKDENDVEGAAGRAIAKFLVYRESKRRLADLRNQHQAVLSRKRFLDKELDATRERIPENERKLRAMMRDKGFTDEARYKDVNEALTAYCRFCDVAEEIVSRQELLLQGKATLTARLEGDAALYARRQAELKALLDQAGIDSPALAHDAAEKSALLRELNGEARELETRLETILEGRVLAELTEEVLSESAENEAEALPEPEELAQEQRALEGQLQEALRDYREVHRTRTAMLNAHRPLCEIEEDLRVGEVCLAQLRQSVSAAAVAMALIEEHMSAWRRERSQDLSQRAEGCLEAMGLVACFELHGESQPREALTALIQDAPAGDEQRQLLYLAARLALYSILTEQAPDCPLIIHAPSNEDGAPSPDVLLNAIVTGGAGRQVVVITSSPTLAEVAKDRQFAVYEL